MWDSGRSSSNGLSLARLDSQYGGASSCTVAPLGDHVLAVDDIVLCRVKGAQYLHLVKALQGERIQIGNNRGGINGWIDAPPRAAAR